MTLGVRAEDADSQANVRLGGDRLRDNVHAVICRHNAPERNVATIVDCRYERNPLKRRPAETWRRRNKRNYERRHFACRVRIAIRAGVVAERFGGIEILEQEVEHCVALIIQADRSEKTELEDPAARSGSTGTSQFY